MKPVLQEVIASEPKNPLAGGLDGTTETYFSATDPLITNTMTIRSIA